MATVAMAAAAAVLVGVEEMEDGGPNVGGLGRRVRERGRRLLAGRRRCRLVCDGERRQEPFLDEEGGDGVADGERGVLWGHADGGQRRVPLAEGGLDVFVCRKLCVWGVWERWVVGSKGASVFWIGVNGWNGQTRVGEHTHTHARTHFLRQPFGGLDEVPGAAVPHAGVEEIAVFFGGGVFCFGRGQTRRNSVAIIDCGEISSWPRRVSSAFRGRVARWCASLHDHPPVLGVAPHDGVEPLLEHAPEATVRVFEVDREWG